VSDGGGVQTLLPTALLTHCHGYEHLDSLIAIGRTS
jgi:hypothetical protein